jgi:hypothetical protein
MSDIKFDVRDEIKLLEEALQENEELYSEIKGHYDKVKNSGTGVLQFVEKQTSNLISLKSNKVSIIQQMIAAKKNDAELKIKIKNANKEEKGGNAIVSELSNAMYDLILKNKGEKSFDELVAGSQKNETVVENPEDDIDALLSARIAEDDAKKAKELEAEQGKTDENSGNFFVVDVQGNMYCLDPDYNLIEDAVLPEVNITVVENEEATGNDERYIAYDEDGKYYQVIEFEEE